MSVIAEPTGALAPAGGMLGGVLVLALLPLRWPMAGAVLALTYAVWAVAFFPHPAAWALLAAPAGVSGVLLLAGGRRLRPVAATRA
ncbi:MAG: hypothetical protein SFY69_00145 [Planctomycetota bacterium]|nr:hypothetical protein [Planctomycetota bacterium]